MSEEEFTIESIGMEESYCDHSCILRGEEVISDGIPSADARSIVEILNGLYDENKQLKEENEQLRQFINKGRRLSVKELMDNVNENELLKKKIRGLEKENKELNSIKKFAEKNGINIFLIEEAFRKCWKDNGKLFEENKKLRQELNGKDCRKCENYCRDKALDYCLVDEREPYYFSPLEWDYKAEAEKCKYYYR